ASRLTTKASSNSERIHVLLPVPLGPKRKKDERGVFRRRVYIDTNFTVKMVPVYTAYCFLFPTHVPSDRPSTRIRPFAESPSIQPARTVRTGPGAPWRLPC